MLLTFVYGLATVQFEIFPYEIIRQAKNGFEALKLLENDQHQVTIKSWSDEGGPKPGIIRHAPAGGG